MFNVQFKHIQSECMLSVPLTSSLSIIYKCKASSPQAVPVYADPAYGEMAEGYTLKACIKADRMEICEWNT